MGHLKTIDLPDATDTPTRAAGAVSPSRTWVWVVVAVLAIGGFWYYRSSHKANGPAVAGAGAPGAGGLMGGLANPNFSVPVVVATTSKGDLPVYLNGLGTVTPLNTVTVRSRVDGQLINVAFKEGQFVKEGDLLAEIDPRPFQVQLEQAEGQLAKDTAQRKDAEVNLERYQMLFKEGVIPQQQLDTQAASVGQFDGAIKTDQGQIDNQAAADLRAHHFANFRASGLAPGRSGQHRSRHRYQWAGDHHPGAAHRRDFHAAAGSVATGV